jgi:hypothetical protein
MSSTSEKITEQNIKKISSKRSTCLLRCSLRLRSLEIVPKNVGLNSTTETASDFFNMFSGIWILKTANTKTLNNETDQNIKQTSYN